jgi:hypothetical protein
MHTTVNTQTTPAANAIGHEAPESIKALQKRIGPPVWKLNVKREWLVDCFIACGSVTLLIGEAGHGKSFIATQLAKSVAQGEDFLGCEVEQHPVLYVDGEMSAVDVKVRLAETFGLDFDSPGLEDRLLILGDWCKEPLGRDGPKDAEIIAFAKETKGLIIFDSLIAWHPGSENDSTETRRYMNLFLTLAHEHGATVVVLHHKTNKSNNERAKAGRGSSDIPAVVDVTYNVTGTKATKRDSVGKLYQLLTTIKLEPGQKVRSGTTFSANCKIVDGKGLIACGTLPSTPVNQLTLRERVLQFLAENPDSGQNDISKALDEKRKPVETVLSVLAIEGHIVTLAPKRKGRKTLYRPAGTSTRRDGQPVPNLPRRETIQ